MVKYSKPFKDYDEQLNILIERKLNIPNRNRALNALSNYSYYHLVNGSKNSLVLNLESNEYNDGISFDDLYRIFILDSTFKSIILKYILYVEKSLKSKLSHLIAKSFGVYSDYESKLVNVPGDYLFENNYSNANKNRLYTLSKLKEYLIKPNKNSPVFDYKNRHNHIPPWILAETIDFGDVIRWYEILCENDKDLIVNQMIITSSLYPIIEKKELLIKSLYVLKEFRNKCAHGNKIISSNSINELPNKSLFNLIKYIDGYLSIDEYNMNVGKKDFFACLTSIIILLNDYHISEQLITELKEYTRIYNSKDYLSFDCLDILGLPRNYIERLVSFHKFRYDYSSFIK